HGQHNLIVKLISVDARKTREQWRLAELSESPADFVLENDNDREHEVGQNIRQHPGDRFQADTAREIEENYDQRQTEGHLDRSRSFNEYQQTIADRRDDEDVQQRRPGQMRY